MRQMPGITLTLYLKLQRGTISYEEMLVIAGALNVGYEQALILPDGSEIKPGSK